jgi:hypothetical protein
MATAAQPVQTQQWDPVAAARQKYPGLANEPDTKILQHLSDPNNFRNAFPEYGHLDDQVITRNMASHLAATLTQLEKGRTEGPDRGYWSGIKTAIGSDFAKSAALNALTLGGYSGVQTARGLIDTAKNAKANYQAGSQGAHEANAATGANVPGSEKLAGVAGVLAPMVGVNPQSMRARGACRY